MNTPVALYLPPLLPEKFRMLLIEDFMNCAIHVLINKDV